MQNNNRIYQTISIHGRDPAFISDIERKSKHIFKVLNNKCLDASNEKKSEWLIIKNTFPSEKTRGYKLRENDYIKFGKIVFLIKKVQLLETNIKEISKDLIKKSSIMNINKIGMNNFQLDAFNEQENNFLDIKPNVSNIGSIKKFQNFRRKKVNSCRICLCEDNSIENPLINPCKCIGSVKYIHLECLKTWLSSKILCKKFNYLIVYSLRYIECEICKYKICEKVKVNNKLFELIDIEYPTDNYIILETFSKEKKDSRFLYIIHLNEAKSIKMVCYILLRVDQMMQTLG